MDSIAAKKNRIVEVLTGIPSADTTLTSSIVAPMSNTMLFEYNAKGVLVNFYSQRRVAISSLEIDGVDIIASLNDKMNADDVHPTADTFENILPLDFDTSIRVFGYTKATASTPKPLRFEIWRTQ